MGESGVAEFYRECYNQWMLKKEWPLWVRIPVIIFILLGFFYFFIFRSTDYDGAVSNAIRTRNPSKCNQLTNRMGLFAGGDVNLRDSCYSKSIFTIKDPSLCDKYPIPFCREDMAAAFGNVSFCSPITDPNSYNYCVYKAAQGSRNPAVCDSLKGGTNYSKDRCILQIVEINRQSIPSSFSVREAQNVCSEIGEKQLKDYCLVNIIMMSKDTSLCPFVNNFSNFDNTLTVDGIPSIDICKWMIR